MEVNPKDFSAQNIVFEQVALNVKPGSGGQVLDLIDGFYGKIDKPEGVYITLYAVNFKADDIQATHFLTFSGSVEGLAKLREIRSGDKYLLYNSNMLRHSEITSISAVNSNRGPVFERFLKINCLAITYPWSLK